MSQMSEIHIEKPVPRRALQAAGGLIALTILAAFAAHWMNFGAWHVRPTAITESRQLLIADLPNGGIRVTDAATHEVVSDLAPGSNGFIRGVMRGLSRERRARGLGAEAPFTLVRRSNGLLALIDPTKGGSVIELGSFGSNNATAFSSLLTVKGPAS